MFFMGSCYLQKLSRLEVVCTPKSSVGANPTLFGILSDLLNFLVRAGG